MAQTRAQTASQKGRNSPYKAPRHASVRRSPRLKILQPSPDLPLSAARQGSKRAIETTRDSEDFGLEHSAKRRRVSNQSASEDTESRPASDCNPIEFWAREGYWPHK
ncbi:hypothetical protein PG987_003103 [Apiospora arundinis]|uniref:Uncharacterized protein n=1 Tax=Apiospora arundinis TaxID=335852 RepID=A0ABR2HZ20_9PEZI